jgi:molecular chaperone DnaK (HSP70)
MANPKGNVTTLTHYQPKWNSGTTQVIRVPITLVPRIIDYARRLDQGTGKEDQVLNKQSLLQVIEDLEQVLDTPRNNFSREKKAKLQSAIDRLQSVVTSD